MNNCVNCKHFIYTISVIRVEFQLDCEIEFTATLSVTIPQSWIPFMKVPIFVRLLILLSVGGVLAVESFLGTEIV